MGVTIDNNGMLHDTVGKFAGSVNGGGMQYDLFGNEHKEESITVANRKSMTMFKAGAAVGAAMCLAAHASPADANDNYDLFTAAGSSTSSSYNEDDYISGGDREGSTGNGLDPDDDSELDSDGSHGENDSDAPENREFTFDELMRPTPEVIASLRPGNILPHNENFVQMTIASAEEHGIRGSSHLTVYLADRASEASGF